MNAEAGTALVRYVDSPGVYTSYTYKFSGDPRHNIGTISMDDVILKVNVEKAGHRTRLSQQYRIPAADIEIIKTLF